MFFKQQEHISQNLLGYFQKVGLSSPFTFDDVFGALDVLIQHQFDRSIANELYENMIKNPDGSVSVQEFLRVYFEAEQILTVSLEQSSNKMVKLRNERQVLRDKLNEASKTENLNHQGLMSDSKIIIQLKKVENIFSYKDYQKYYLILEFDSLSYKTKHYQCFNGLIQLNEQVEFSTKDPFSDLKIYLMDTRNYNVMQCEAQQIFGLDSYKDQQQHSEFIDLYNRKGEPTNTKISFDIQWMYSKTKYYSEGVDKWDQKIFEEEENVREIEKNLRILYDPIRYLEQMIQQGQLKQSPSNIKGHRFIQVDQQQHQQNQQLKGDNKSTSKQFKNFNWHFANLDNSEKWSKILLFSIVVLSIFCSLGSFQKSNFLDLGILLSLLYYMMNQQIDKSKTKFFMIFLIFSIIMDLIWMIFYRYDNWVAGTKLFNNNTDKSIKLFTYVMAYINLISKGIFAAILYKFSTYFPEN